MDTSQEAIASVEGRESLVTLVEEVVELEDRAVAELGKAVQVMEGTP